MTTPAAPRNVNAIAGNTMITIQFQKPIDDGGLQITEYDVYQSYPVLTNPNVPVKVLSNPDPLASIYSVDINGLTNGTVYEFYVKAKNSAGSSIASPSVVAQPISVTSTYPDPPTITGATPGNTQVQITFVAPANNGGSPITEYKLLVNNGVAGQFSTTSVSPITATGLTNGITYNFLLIAYNINGASPASNLFTATPIAPATVPSPPSNVVATASDQKVSVSFSPSSSDGGSTINNYTVFVYKITTGGNISSGTFSNQSSPIQISGLTNGAQYSFYVVASNAMGFSQPSQTVYATPRTTASAPQTVSATSDNGFVSISFVAPLSDGGSPITKYILNVINGSVITPFEGTSSPIMAIGLTNGTPYVFSIYAVNAAGNGALATVNATPATVPDAPTNVVATPASSQVSIAFQAPASNGKPITNYEVYVNANTTPAASGVSSPIIVTGLTNGTSYTFRVKAINAMGASDASLSVSSTPNAPTTIPGAPTNLVATMTPSNQVSVAFTTPSSDGGSAITMYTLKAVNTNGITSTFTNASSPIIATSLTLGTQYTLTVRATNAKGDSPESVVITFTPATKPDAPTNVTTAVGNQQVSVQFAIPSANGSPITNYTLTAMDGSSANKIFTGTSSPIVATGLTNNVSYSFFVFATNSFGNSANSTTVTATPIAPNGAIPAVPTNIVVTSGNQQLIVGFQLVDGATSYVVTVKAGSDEKTFEATTSPITCTGLTNGTTYDCTVIAKNAAGSSNASSPAVQKKPYTIPSTPTGVTATPGDQQVTISFTASANNGGDPITSYRLTAFASNIVQTSTSSPITITGLTNGTMYSFNLVAINNAGPSAPPVTVTSTPIAGIVPPAAPTNLTVTAQNQQLTVSFTPGSTGGASIVTYKLIYSINSVQVGTVDGNSSPIVATGLTNGTTYSLVVRASNSAGFNNSTAVTGTPSAPPAVPSTPTNVQATAGDAQATISFTPSSNGSLPITYMVYKNNDTESSASGTTSPIVVTGLTNNEEYSFYVTATNGAGASNRSSPAATATPTANNTNTNSKSSGFFSQFSTITLIIAGVVTIIGAGVAIYLVNKRVSKRAFDQLKTDESLY